MKAGGHLNAPFIFVSGHVTQYTRDEKKRLFFLACVNNFVTFNLVEV
jgi:hypothetical protein